MFDTLTFTIRYPFHNPFFEILVMGKYVRNARFCLICNYVSKIIPALQSRCTRFRFQPLPEIFVRTRLDYICVEEKIKVIEGGLDALIELGAGDMRRTLNLLQSTCMSSDEVSEASAYACAGKPLPADIESCAQWLLNEPLNVAFRSKYFLPNFLCFLAPFPTLKNPSTYTTSCTTIFYYVSSVKVMYIFSFLLYL